MSETTKDSWPIDGSSHSDVSQEALYLNADIKDFLRSDRRTILISAKGMGKTLLLRAKRYKMELEDTGVDIIPKESQFDIPVLPAGLPEGVWSDTDLWSAIWQASIVFSIISNNWLNRPTNNSQMIAKDPYAQEPMWHLIDQLDIGEDFKKQLKNDFQSRQGNMPSFYVDRILNQSIGMIRRFQNSLRVVHQISSKYIVSAKAVFIDAFDQTLQDTFPNDIGAWKSAQNGLLKAAHKLNIANPHIKTFITVRQEAFAGFDDPDREVIRGRSLLISYNAEELEEMFLHALRRYTECNKIDEFFAIDKIKNLYYKNVTEKPIGYVYRHSTGTPRCILGLGRDLAKLELWKRNRDDPQKYIREVVNQSSGNYVFNDYLQTQRQFLLQTLRDKETIQQLFQLIPTNVLRYRDLLAISQAFATKLGVKKEPHPFCELFNIGLIGTAVMNYATNELVQTFKKPFEFSWQFETLVQERRIYFLHPSLYDAISSYNSNFLINCGVLVGDHCRVIVGKKKLFPTLFLSYSSKDKAMVERIKPLLDQRLSLRTPADFWFDSEKIGIGEITHKALENGIHQSDVVVLFISKASLDSKWVEKEWRTKHESEVSTGKIQVVTVIIDETKSASMPEFLRNKSFKKLPSENSADFTQKLDQLGEAIATLLCGSVYYKARKGVFPIVP